MGGVGMWAPVSAHIVAYYEGTTKVVVVPVRVDQNHPLFIFSFQRNSDVTIIKEVYLLFLEMMCMCGMYVHPFGMHLVAFLVSFQRRVLQSYKV